MMPRRENARRARESPGAVADAGARDISGLASVLADPSRAGMLDVLLDGEAHPIGTLARRVRVSPATASSHLRRLDEAGLVVVEQVGRERRVRLASADVAAVLEYIAVLARPNVHAPELHHLRFARTCYDHLAGLLGVAIAERLVDLGWLYRTSDNLEPSARLLAWLADHGHPVAEEARARPLSRACVDWTERSPHLAGRVGASLASLVIEAGWVRRVRASRSLRLTDRGRRAFADELGLVLRAR
jgi:DNA-binding transcriptional ArsR family regulator